jgi:hypothetical protein
VMESATVSACSCWPALASTPATSASASACRSGLVMERADHRYHGGFWPLISRCP